MSNIADIRRKPVSLDLPDGKPRTMKYTLNSFAAMEEKYGSIDDAMKAMEDGSIKALRFMIYAGLMHNKENPITEEELGEMLEMLDLELITEKMNLVMQIDMPQPDPNK